MRLTLTALGMSLVFPKESLLLTHMLLCFYDSERHLIGKRSITHDVLDQWVKVRSYLVRVTPLYDTV